MILPEKLKYQTADIDIMSKTIMQTEDIDIKRKGNRITERERQGY